MMKNDIILHNIATLLHMTTILVYTCRSLYRKSETTQHMFHI